MSERNDAKGSNERSYRVNRGDRSVVVDESMLRTGDVMDLATLAGDLNNAPSPDTTLSLGEFLSKNGMTFDQYIANAGAQPWRIENGQAVYDPSAKVNNYSYEGTSNDFANFLKAAGLAFGGAYGLNALLGGAAAGAGAGAGAGAVAPSSALQGALTGAGEFSLAAPGAGIGGVGNAGLGLQQVAGTSGGLIGNTAANLAAAGGVGLPAIAGTSTGLGLVGSPVSGGLIEGMASNLASQAGVTLPPATNSVLPQSAASGTTPPGPPSPPKNPAGPATGASALSEALKKLGIDVDPSTLGLLGTLGSTALGVYGSKQQTDALKSIADQSRSDRLPALNAFNTALTNPNSFYESAPAQGAVDSVLRKLSAQHGNPALSPTALSQAAAYNLGGYNDYLRTTGNLGFSGQDSSMRAQTNAVLSQNNMYNALGSGLSSLTNSQPNINSLLAQYLGSQLGVT